MGIDIYMRWDGQTEDERDAQYTGFSVCHGHVGYLREAYHGGDLATPTLVPEAFDAQSEVEISSALMRERLPAAIEKAITREIEVYKAPPEKAPKADMVKSLRDFVALAEQKERETGKPVRVLVV